MLTDEQLIQRLRSALESETAGIDPPPRLLGNIHDQLRNPSKGERRPARAPSLSGVLTALGAAVAVAVAVGALLLTGHNHPATQRQGTVSTVPGTIALVAQAPDPQAGVPWALRTVQRSRSQTCLQVGRLLPATTGAVGQRSFSSDPNLAHCAPTDARGHAFLNVFAREVPAGAGTNSTSAECQVGVGRGSTPLCPLTNYRNLAYGLLGPDALAISYTVNGHSVTKRTGGTDAAYLVVLPATTESCFLLQGGGRSCEGGTGETSTTDLQSGVITAVTYRDGHVCRLPAPTAGAVAAESCPTVGYAAPKTQPFRPPHITSAQVAAPVSVVTFPPGKRICYRTYHEETIPCDLCIPRGYKLAVSGLGGQRLVEISFTARLAATNQHSVYEWALSGQNCSGTGSGTSATTMTPIRAGQHVVLRTTVAPCRGRYTGLVTYQPNGWPGHDTLSAPHDFTSQPIDGSTVVGRFSFVVR